MLHLKSLERSLSANSQSAAIFSHNTVSEPLSYSLFFSPCFPPPSQPTWTHWRPWFTTTASILMGKFLLALCGVLPELTGRWQQRPVYQRHLADWAARFVQIVRVRSRASNWRWFFKSLLLKRVFDGRSAKFTFTFLTLLINSQMQELTIVFYKAQRPFIICLLKRCEVRCKINLAPQCRDRKTRVMAVGSGWF